MSESTDNIAKQAWSAYQRSDCLYTAEQVQAALDAMAHDITERLASANPLVLCVMTGGIIPCGQLLPRLRFPLQVDYLHASRYRGGTAGGDLHWIKQPDADPRGRTVLIVDDVLDEGITLQAIVAHYANAGAVEILTAVLVEKRLAHRSGLPNADFVGLLADDRYLFGVGMDYKTYLRNIDGIYAINSPTP